MAVLFENSFPQSYNDNKVNVEFQELNEFQIDLLNKNKTFINKCLSRKSGVEVQFVFVVKKVLEKENIAQKDKARKEEEIRLFEKLKNEDPMVAKLIEELDLKLV